MTPPTTHAARTIVTALRALTYVLTANLFVRNNGEALIAVYLNGSECERTFGVALAHNPLLPDLVIFVRDGRVRMSILCPTIAPFGHLSLDSAEFPQMSRTPTKALHTLFRSFSDLFETIGIPPDMPFASDFSLHNESRLDKHEAIEYLSGLYKIPHGKVAISC